MSRILTITNFGDFQFIEQTREDNQIKYVPKGNFVSTTNTLEYYKHMAVEMNCSYTVCLARAYVILGGKFV